MNEPNSPDAILSNPANTIALARNAALKERIHLQELWPHIPTITPDPECPITELQSAFGSLLLARGTHRTFQTTVSPPPEPTYWTMPFNLFALPRELRDTIYFHVLHRPAGIKYRRKTTKAYPWETPPHTPSLFLVNRQTHDESLRVFCRYNQISIERRSGWHRTGYHERAIQGTLRLFPDQPARFLQKVRMQYYQQQSIYVSHDHASVSVELGTTFAQILRDAHSCKSIFPRLREFSVDWQVSLYYGDESYTRVAYEGMSEEEKVVIWLRWMRGWVGRGSVKPPSYVVFGMEDAWGVEHVGAVNGAYGRLVGEWRGDGGLEESGRVWLEGMGSERRGRKRGRKRKASK